MILMGTEYNGRENRMISKRKHLDRADSGRAQEANQEMTRASSEVGVVEAGSMIQSEHLG